jgi:hemerythrin
MTSLVDELCILEAEHQNLHAIASALDVYCLSSEKKGQCDCCAWRMVSECATTLNARLAVLVIFLMRLSRHEERLMKGGCPSQEALRQVDGHVENHEDLWAELSVIAKTVPAISPAEAYERLARLMKRWIGEHGATYDEDMLRQLVVACHYSQSVGHHP